MHKMLDMHMHEMHVMRMKLSHYLTEQKLTDAAFGVLVGMSQSQVNRIRRGRSRPSWESMAAIEKATAGKVTARDFISTASGAAS